MRTISCRSASVEQIFHPQEAAVVEVEVQIHLLIVHGIVTGEQPHAQCVGKIPVNLTAQKGQLAAVLIIRCLHPFRFLADSVIDKRLYLGILQSVDLGIVDMNLPIRRLHDFLMLRNQQIVLVVKSV